MTVNPIRLDREARVPAISPEEFYNRVADQDSRPVPEFLRESRPYAGGSYEVSVDRFLSKEFHDLEVERLWKRVWQMACREEQIPEVGDMVVYEVATLQFIIVRSAPDRIKAYPNACLHRGRQLVDCDQHASRIRCPFHGFTWDLEGRITSIPLAWEFSRIDDPEHWSLPECRVETWGGFVFINPDPDAEPLKDFLGDIDRHYERYPLEDRYLSAHARKVVPANWKIAQDAFLEAYHVYGTHPQLVPQASHSDWKYDCYENYSRALGVNYIPNAYMAFEPTAQDLFDSIVDLRLDEERATVAREDLTPRQQMAAAARAGLERLTGESADKYADTELIDTCFMSIFPNLHPWTLFNRVGYLFRPYKDDPDKCWMDIFILAPFDKSKGRPPAAKTYTLSDDQDWTCAPDNPVYHSRIANQDTFNMEPIQRGLKATRKSVLEYSSYQESRVRHFHDLLDKWLAPTP